MRQRIKELETQVAELRAENVALKKVTGDLQAALDHHHAVSAANYERMSRRFARIREIDARHLREKSQWHENDRLEHKHLDRPAGIGDGLASLARPETPVPGSSGPSAGKEK